MAVGELEDRAPDGPHHLVRNDDDSTDPLLDGALQHGLEIVLASQEHVDVSHTYRGQLLLGVPGEPAMSRILGIAEHAERLRSGDGLPEDLGCLRRHRTARGPCEARQVATGAGEACRELHCYG